MAHQIAPMPLSMVSRVVNSAIHGYGVVTTRRVQEGRDRLLRRRRALHGGCRLRRHVRADPPGEDSGLGEHFFWDLVARRAGSITRAIRTPRSLSKWDHETNTCRAWWVALRDIPVGEEITYDYAFVADVAEPCACGAASCRGLIVDPDPAELAQAPRAPPAAVAPHGARGFVTHRIGILTGGGDCPGLNGVIRAVTLHAHAHASAGRSSASATASRASTRRVRRSRPRTSTTCLLGRGGTMLGSNNRANPFAYPVELPDGRVEIHDVSTRCMANLAQARPARA